MKCMKKYADGGMMGGPSNRDMRESDRASRESYRMARPERRLARNREDVGRLLDDIEGYDPQSQINRNMARKIAAMTLGAAALPVGIGLNNAIDNARRMAMRGRYDTIFGNYTNKQELNAMERLLIDIFGINRNMYDQ